MGARCTPVCAMVLLNAHGALRLPTRPASVASSTVLSLDDLEEACDLEREPEAGVPSVLRTFFERDMYLSGQIGVFVDVLRTRESHGMPVPKLIAVETDGSSPWVASEGFSSDRAMLLYQSSAGRAAFMVDDFRQTVRTRRTYVEALEEDGTPKRFKVVGVCTGFVVGTQEWSVRPSFQRGVDGTLGSDDAYAPFWKRMTAPVCFVASRTALRVIPEVAGRSKPGTNDHAIAILNVIDDARRPAIVVMDCACGQYDPDKVLAGFAAMKTAFGPEYAAVQSGLVRAFRPDDVYSCSSMAEIAQGCHEAHLDNIEKPISDVTIASALSDVRLHYDVAVCGEDESSFFSDSFFADGTERSADDADPTHTVL
jgi:hypothetical protein